MLCEWAYKPKIKLKGVLCMRNYELENIIDEALDIARTTCDDYLEGEINYDGISAIVEEWYKNRKDTIEEWGDTRIKMETNEPDKNAIRELLAEFAYRVSEGVGYTVARKRYNMEELCVIMSESRSVCRALNAVRSLLTSSYTYESVVKNSLLELPLDGTILCRSLEELGVKVTKGEKITKIIVKILRKGVKKALDNAELEKNQYDVCMKEIDILSQNYSQLVEKFKSMSVTKIVWLSVDVRDFLRCSYGYEWYSCHRLGGEFGSGAISYALNPRVAIAYVEKISDCDVRKLEWREIVYMNEDHNVFVGSRQYKYENKSFADTVQKIIMSVYGENFEQYDGYNTNDMQKMAQKHIYYGSEFGYNDIHLYNGIDKHLWVLKAPNAEVEKIDIHHDHIYCVDCGEKISQNDIRDNSHVHCSRCNHDCQCDLCGDYHDEEDMVYIDGVGYVCEWCLEHEFTYCESCESYHYNDDVQYVENFGYACYECLRNSDDFFYCGECDEWHIVENLEYGYRDNEEVCVCSDCLDRYYVMCEKCGKYIHENDIVYDTDDEGNDYAHCVDCE